VPGHVVTILMQERWSENHSTYLWKFAAFLQKERYYFSVCCDIKLMVKKLSIILQYFSFNVL